MHEFCCAVATTAARDGRGACALHLDNITKCPLYVAGLE